MNIEPGAKVRDRVSGAKGVVRSVRGLNGHRYATIDFTDGTVEVLNARDLTFLGRT